MSQLFAVDPGTRESGLAVFQDKILTGAWAVKAKGATPDARVVDVVRQMVEIIRPRILTPSGGTIEMPQVYRHGPGSVIDPDDILLLTLVVGGVVCGLPELEWKRVHPAAWKGQVPKTVMTNRITKRLAESERAVVATTNDNHNAIDSVGLGLWALSRLG